MSDTTAIPAAASEAPKAILYTASVSIWGSVPLLAFIEKGYSPSDYQVRMVDLLEAENFAPSYLRINSKGTVPTLVVPLAETASAEVDTKFRALDGSIAITEFLDASRSQSLLDIKGDESSRPAPVLSPATMEGKATADEVIQLLQAATADPNGLLLAARTPDELQRQRQGLQGKFCHNRQAALQRFKAEALAHAGGENPRTAQMTERLVQWYDDKEASLRPLHAAYLDGDAQASQAFLQQSQALWQGTAHVLAQLETKIVGPLLFGDQLSLADLHVMAWLARVMSVAQAVEGQKDEVTAMQMALRHPILQDNVDAQKGLGAKVVQYWQTVKERPSFQQVYKDGLH